MNWTPLGVDAVTHAALVDGIPPWMVASVTDWVKREFTESAVWSGAVWDVDRMRRFDLAARVAYSPKLGSVGANALFGSLKDDEAIRLLDWLVYDNATQYGGEDNDALEAILSAAGSKWTVGVRDGVGGLEERVPEGVRDAAEAAMTAPGDAGRLLSEAWHAVYGMNPQPDLGYRKSIEAVEAVVLPAVMANDDTATLGKAIGQMRAQGDWKLPFIKEHKRNPSEDVVLGIMQSLWSGHSDRHPGTGSYIASTQEAAEAAVSLAVTLVNLFVNGGIARRS